MVYCKELVTTYAPLDGMIVSKTHEGPQVVGVSAEDLPEYKE
jgi:hypothetical protein